MSILVLCNVGNSDLKADGKRPTNPRQEGRQIWENLSDHQIELPIIEPCVREILTTNAQINRLILFFTDQPPSKQTEAPDRFGIPFRDKDTLWYAHIAQRVLEERFGAKIGVVERVRVERSNGQTINPSVYDEAFDAYGDLVTRTYDSDAQTCYVFMAGGIPACNSALQLHGLSAYGERCRFIYQPESGDPYELRVGNQMQATFHRAGAITALKQRDFATARRAVAELTKTGVADNALKALLDYACYREAFDFERAQAALAEGIRAASGDFRSFLNSLRPELDVLVGREDIGALLREVQFNATLTFSNERYADFVGRIFRFQEAALRYIVETKLGLPTDMSKAKKQINLAAYQQGIAGNPNLSTYLDSRIIDEQPLRYREGPNILVMQAMLEFLVQPGLRADNSPYLAKNDQGRYGEIRKRLNKLQDLSQLRNQSIIAHGFIGVSRERLDLEYGNNARGILEDLQKVMNLLGVAAGQSPFDRIAEEAERRLRRSAV